MTLMPGTRYRFKIPTMYSGAFEVVEADVYAVCATGVYAHIASTDTIEHMVPLGGWTWTSIGVVSRDETVVGRMLRHVKKSLGGVPPTLMSAVQSLCVLE